MAVYVVMKSPSGCLPKIGKVAQSTYETTGITGCQCTATHLIRGIQTTNRLIPEWVLHIAVETQLPYMRVPNGAHALRCVFTYSIACRCDNIPRNLLLLISFVPWKVDNQCGANLRYPVNKCDTGGVLSKQVCIHSIQRGYHLSPE